MGYLQTTALFFCFYALVNTGINAQCSNEACPPCPAGQIPLRDENSCQISCQCFDPCQNIECERGSLCELQEVTCITTPCDPVPVCNEYTNYQCPREKAFIPSEHVCPNNCTSDSDCGTNFLCCENTCGGKMCVRGECKQIGEVGCENYRTMFEDKYGCPYLKCVSPCEQRVTCVTGNYCEFTPDVYWYADAHATLCKPCPPSDCPACPLGHGYKQLRNRCPSCECYDVCEGHSCGEDEICVQVERGCETKKCNPVPFCQSTISTTKSTTTLSTTTPDPENPPECGDIDCLPCGPSAVPVRDTKGCRIPCQCQNPCSEVKCGEDKICLLQESVCNKLPCDPIAVCKDIVPCPDVKCEKCDEGLVPTRMSNGCIDSVCTCHDPCKPVICRPYQKCELQKLESCTSEAHCDPVPRCVDVSSDAVVGQITLPFLLLGLLSFLNSIIVDLF